MPPVNPTHPARGGTAHPTTPDSLSPDALNTDDFDEELKRLSAASRELLESLRAPASSAPAADGDDVALLRLENGELRARVEELEQLLQSAGPGDEVWADRQREYEALLEEKSEVIRALHQKIRELQDRQARSMEDDVTLPPNDVSLLKHQLEEQRRQLQEDEEAMISQLREMEMTLSRDRADLARQRQEVQRLQADLAREIEMASRDPSLRDRLLNLRRPNEKSKTSGAQPSVTDPTPPPQPTPAVKGSGLFRRLFG
jgi:hypothetical protein